MTINKHIQKAPFFASECKTIKHQLGEACVPRNPQRIIVTDESILDAVVGLGFKPIAAAESNALGNRGRQFGNKIDGIISIGKESLLNLERIVKLQPDLILGFEINENDYEILSKIAPTVSIEFNEIAWKEALQRIGDILNKSTVSKQLLNEYQQRVEKLRLAILQNNNKQKVSISRFYSGWNLTQFQNQFSFPVRILEEVGLSIPEAQQKLSNSSQSYISVGIESLNLLDADVMFVALDPGSAKNFQKYSSHQFWQMLNVIKNNRVYTVDSGYWIVGNILSANAILDDLSQYLLSR
ncbi:ABC transporter periplasmic component [Dulcicalothrix desertica PCC 7102]|uniref:ABC transporter periplasmic component n=1 Tax=Dulcicalothrix desertica PCC 7102 TaxID=232991 RepID=A0A3S1CHG7_9CYAN|nr:iron-siderophore ABC transporter substrate-binding protein [Dulcicalothrix desertica]RUT07366.1 ABC transporter periplasmic component [Dulcicalothrix desertica PCC 7102]